MSKERDKIIQALENMSITFDELGFAPTTLTDKKCEHFGDWFKYEIATIKAVSKKQDEQLAEKDKIYVESLIKLEKESEEQLEKQATIYYRHLKEKDQEKIEFAVEQLTLFKNTIVNKMNNPYSVNIKHILSDFDNQIKRLKEGK